MNHIKQIAAKLPEYGLDAMLITSEPGEYYAVGFHGEGVVLVTPEESWYYTDSRYIEAAQEQVENAHVSLPQQGRNYRATVEDLIQAHGWKSVGFEEDYMTVSAYKLWTDGLSAELKPASKLLECLRASKDQEEIEAMIAAQRIAERALEETLAFLKPGVTEKEIAAYLEYKMLSFGAEKKSFDTIIASGPNSSRPHAVPGDRKIQNGDFVTIDFGCMVNGYCSDTTRTVAVGEPTEEMRKVYDIVLQAQLAGIAAARAGLSGKEIDAAARKVIEDAGYGEYFGHSFGHSLGIEIHENPNLSPSNPEPMPVGAVVSAEPGIYLPGKFGVRIEDVMILTDEGAEDITKYPKELIIL
ncbi:MAG: M24 family metallopeptidase [Oscillospiraceae bacterium]